MTGNSVSHAFYEARRHFLAPLVIRSGEEDDAEH